VRDKQKKGGLRSMRNMEGRVKFILRQRSTYNSR
jgi:hypothetical protein